MPGAGLAVAPEDGLVACEPADGRVTFVPAEGRVAVAPAEGRVAVAPAEGRTTFLSVEGRGFVPAEGVGVAPAEELGLVPDAGLVTWLPPAGFGETTDVLGLVAAVFPGLRSGALLAEGRVTCFASEPLTADVFLVGCDDVAAPLVTDDDLETDADLDGVGPDPDLLACAKALD